MPARSPHFHAQYGDAKASVRIDDGEVVAGKLPGRAGRLVEEWPSQHAEELAAVWNRAQLKELPGKIEPLVWEVEMTRIVNVVTDPANYVLTLTLDDGRTAQYDVTPMLWGPVFEPLKSDRALFDAVKVSDYGDTVTWPTGADIAPEALLAEITVTS